MSEGSAYSRKIVEDGAYLDEIRCAATTDRAGIGPAGLRRCQLFIGHAGDHGSGWMPPYRPLEARTVRWADGGDPYPHDGSRLPWAAFQWD